MCYAISGPSGGLLMPHYLDQFDATLPAERWTRVRRWMFEEPLPFYAELRDHRPVLAMPELTLATRYADCALILRRHDDFGVDLYKPKQGPYWMAQDETAQHVREKAIMTAILDREDIPEMRRWIAAETARRLDDAGWGIEAVNELSRAVPIAFVQAWFGFGEAEPAHLQEWSYWNQQDAFHNQPFDRRPDAQAVIDARGRVGLMMGLFLARIVAERTIAVKLGLSKHDPVSRLLQLSFSGGVKFNLQQVVYNSGGLLIGAVETTSHTVINALQELLARPDVLTEARALAMEDDLASFDGFVFEALRFRPAFPYFFRTCHRATELAGGTPFASTVQPGTTVLAVTHSAMFDGASFPDAERFVPDRARADEFTFGQGLHQCLGVAIGRIIIPEIVRQCLRLPGLRAEAQPEIKGDVPERWPLRWGLPGPA